MIDILKNKFEEVMTRLPKDKQFQFRIDYHPEHLIEVNGWTPCEVDRLIEDMGKYHA